jgi:glycosyltransferase involved in cell wall biosynthesis
VVSVGRLTPQKGYDALLGAAALVVGRHPEVRFVIVGRGPLERPLDARIADLGLVSHVIRLAEHDDVTGLLAAAELLAMPSLFEGLPLVALEAMAVGRPVVGTRVCGIDEAVQHGLTGRLVGAGQVDALAAAISETLGDRGLAAGWGLAGRRRFEERFTAARMVAQTEQVIAEWFWESGPGGPEATSDATTDPRTLAAVG